MQSNHPVSILQMAVIELVLWSVAFIEILNDYIKVIAAIAATATFIFALVKFMRDERDRKQRNKLTELQIENELRRNEYLKSKHSNE